MTTVLAIHKKYTAMKARMCNRKERRSPPGRILRRCHMLILILAMLPMFDFYEMPPPSKNTGDDPEFAMPIGNLTYPVGREAVLSCAVNNLGKYKVGWLRVEDQTVLSLHTRVVTHNTRVSVTHDNSHTWQLRIRQLKETDRGCYMCQINTNVMKKQFGCLDVHVPPDILNEDSSADVSVQENENATLSCSAIGHPPPRIMWKREDGEPMLLKKPGSRDMFKQDVFHGNQLHFVRLDRKQMGSFLCIASNDVPPAVSKRITLNVNFAPMVKVPNQLLGAPLDTDVQLECYIEAFPNTINYWVKNRGEMLLDGPKYAIKEEKSSYKVIMWLMIKKFAKADIGTYNCVSTNSLGKSEGTLRLYEIKVNPNLTHGSKNHAGVHRGLAEAVRDLATTTESTSGASKHSLWQMSLMAIVMIGLKLND